MIITEFYEGQGLGNQLWSYASLIAIAKRLNFKFGFQSISKFKGKEIFDLDFGKRVIGLNSSGPGLKINSAAIHWFKENWELHPLDGSNITRIDHNLFSIKNHTKIDGYFQSEDLILPIKEFLLENLQISHLHKNVSNRCVINLRGGEYVHHSELFLGYQYYKNAIDNMLKINPKLEFVVVTDDVELAKEFFPKYEVVSKKSRNFDIKGRETFDYEKAASDFAILQSANYLILSNSSFSWWGAWTNLEAEVVIAPKYWARHNTSDGYWSLGDSLTRGWLWQDIEGTIFSYEDCLAEKLQVFGSN
jgi:hypothetical protein